MIAIVDYGMGNLFSIYNALSKVGASPEVIRSPEGLSDAGGVVVPGVGAFGKCMERLERFEGPLSEVLRSGTPVLGICVGMQVLFERSEENPEARGFSWVPGSVVKLTEGVMIPQMGWNDIKIIKGLDILDGIKEGDMFYFVHSYHCVPEERDIIAATTHHGTEVAAVIAKENLYATQFHPEKSGQKGLRILENFVRLCRC